MNRSVKGTVASAMGWVVLLLVVVSTSLLILLAMLHPWSEPDAKSADKDQPLAAPINPPAPASIIAKTTPPPAGVLPNYPDFRPQPFPVAYESAKVQWTLADGKDTNVIRQLAHNHLEYDRMVDENSRIFRRQLVYLKETAASVFEQAKLTHAPVTQLTLPGVNGQELQFQISSSSADAGSSRQGQYTGHLVGNSDSLVTLAFQDGREAFTVLSPKDNLYVVGEPRESGQVIVKAIDPNTYGMGPEEQGDDAIKPGPTQK